MISPFYKELRKLIENRCISREDLYTSTEKFKKLLRLLTDLGFVIEKEDVICVENPAMAILRLIIFHSVRVDIEWVLEFASWSEFEDIICELLKSHGHYVVKRVKVPARTLHGVKRVEFDLISIDLVHATESYVNVLVIEVKHYRHSRLDTREVCLKHINKIRLLLEDKSNITEFMRRLPVRRARTLRIVPLIVTLREYSPSIVEGVPIVPAWKLRDFIENYYMHLDSLLVFTVNRS